MKKFFPLLFLATSVSAFSPVRYVQISTNAIPVQSGGFNVSSGTVSTFTVTSLSVSNINGSAYTAVTGGQLPATATNDDAAAGKLGEYKESVVSAVTVTGANGVWGNITTLSLTAGDWDVSFDNYLASNGGTITGPWQIAISSYSDITTTDQVAGSNLCVVDFTPGLATAAQETCPVFAYRMKLASTIVVYGKEKLNYSAGSPQVSGRLSARRVR